MKRWKLTIVAVTPVVRGRFQFTEATSDQLNKEKQYGHKVPFNEEISLTDPEIVDIVIAAKAIYEVFDLKDAMEINGAKVADVFCRSPYVNFTASISSDGVTMVGSTVFCSFTKEQINAAFNLAEALKAAGWLS